MQRVLVPIDIDPTPPRPGSVVREAAGLTMGTSWSAKAVTTSPLPDLQAELDQVVAQMSHWEPWSNLGRFNRAPAGTWHTLPPEFATVMSYALDVARDTGGRDHHAAGARRRGIDVEGDQDALQTKLYSGSTASVAE